MIRLEFTAVEYGGKFLRFKLKHDQNDWFLYFIETYLKVQSHKLLWVIYSLPKLSAISNSTKVPMYVGVAPS